MLSNIVGLFIGPSSKKRQLGIIIALILSFLYYLNYLDIEIYKALMGLDVLFIGAAFSAKLTKLQKAMINAKK